VVAIAVAALGATSAPASAKTLKASMNGQKEVPTGDPDGTGTAIIRTNRAKGRVCYDIKLSKVGSVTAGHIHRGRKGQAGDVVVPLFAGNTTRPKGCVTGVKKSVIRNIERHPARYYVNVHNADYPAGAVRGQLRG
jgi:hypothetical protein